MRPPTTKLPLAALLLASLVALSLSASTVVPPLKIEVTKPASCTRKTHSGDRISVHYNGTHATDGTSFDSSYKGGVPFTFTLGAGDVIKGWDQGLLDMCIGEGRRLVIPPHLAYGDSGSGPIKGGETLVFETELVAIAGVKPEVEDIPPVPPRPTIVDVPPVPPRPTIVRPDDEGSTEDVAVEAPKPASSLSQSGAADGPPTTAENAGETAQKPETQGSPLANNDNECHLLGPYALFVQGALGLLAVTSLVVKRWREHPRRPLKIWFFDVSKQVVGSAMLHLANLFMSMLSSGSFDVATTTPAVDDGDQPNPCSFYLLNIFIDTTIGIPILVLFLKIFHHLFLLTPLAKPPSSIRSGNYGHPPRITWWLKQCLIYFLGLFCMKLCVFFLFQLLPWIAWVGDWALRWTEGNEAVQITFVMFVFPVVMNAVQYWIIDGFIKDREDYGAEGATGRREGYVGVGHGNEADGEESGFGEEGDDEAWLDRHRSERRTSRGGVGDEERQLLTEANPTPVPVRKGSSGKAKAKEREREYDPGVDGEGST
ncbi:uncharacterized protein EI97DRAFT_401633 [Westerdykella ornata]|uniref:peptidylprolyl isomerase n=1 Tax=Westerdykella ornata TaxID=318751 RepID=A0A6A6JDJ7_WESOR|nr:uncharacterized protein EI97DRAFT_401633 [Westerdykella ornata]KAF2274631.1 hypothetical protein EI97DRAFT_401633 [Westerdykella ornata]